MRKNIIRVLFAVIIYDYVMVLLPKLYLILLNAQESSASDLHMIGDRFKFWLTSPNMVCFVGVLLAWILFKVNKLNVITIVVLSLVTSLETLFIGMGLDDFGLGGVGKRLGYLHDLFLKQTINKMMIVLFFGLLIIYMIIQVISEKKAQKLQLNKVNYLDRNV